MYGSAARQSLAAFFAAPLGLFLVYSNVRREAHDDLRELELREGSRIGTERLMSAIRELEGQL
jgi:hypothetical protein